MRYPTLDRLPPPPPGRTGWPWTEECTPANDENAPRVSIITPSFNQGNFIEETIRSVLLQGYPNLEYIVLDGGSTDGSVDIIHKYAPWLTRWASEPDHGQADAITRGWEQSSGEILAYLNSDDTYLPYAIRTAANALRDNPNTAAICGSELAIDKDGLVISETTIQSATFRDFLALHSIPQPAVFMRRRAWLQAGGFDLQFDNIFDFDLWARLVHHGGIVPIPNLLATTRWHSETKTQKRRSEIAAEIHRVVQKMLASQPGINLSQRERQYALGRLNFVLLGIDLDDPRKHCAQIIEHSMHAIAHWPPLILPLSRMVIANLFHHLRVFIGRNYLQRDVAMRVQSKSRVHWTRWQTTHHQS